MTTLTESKTLRSIVEQLQESTGTHMLDSGGAEEKPFEQGNKHLFMVITSAGPYLSGAIAALKAKDPHAKVAIVYSDDPFSKAVRSGRVHKGVKKLCRAEEQERALERRSGCPDGRSGGRCGGAHGR